MLELYRKPLSEIPMKRIPPKDQRVFVTLVDRILAAKHRNPDADTTAFEQEVDDAVYQLYRFSQDEITTIESYVRNQTKRDSKTEEQPTPWA